MKICTKCKTERSFDNFPRKKSAEDGYDNWCKDCRNKVNREHYAKMSDKYSCNKKKYRRKNRFIVSLQMCKCVSTKRGYKECIATVGEIESRFTGFCEICGVPEKECYRHLNLDHDHVTGKFRGWICSQCNAMLGLSRDCPDTLIEGAGYLEKYSENLNSV